MSVTMSIRVGVLSLLVSGLGCDGDSASVGLGENRAPLLEGRGFDVVGYDSAGTMTTTRLTFGETGSTSPDVVIQAADDWCSKELRIEERLELQYVPHGATATQPPLVCGNDAAKEQQLRLCRGRTLQMLANTVTPIDFHQDPVTAEVTIRFREPGEDPKFNGRYPVFTALPPNASDAATLSIAATVAFQHAALLGGNAMDESECADGTLRGTVPAEILDSGEWSDEQVPLAFVVANATNDAVHSMHDSAEAAARYVTAAGAERRATDRDDRRATRAEFRGKHDSRLELANLYLGVSPRFFESADDPTIIPLDGGMGGVAEEPNGDLPVCDSSSTTAAEERAEDLIREQQIDPRLSDVELEAGALEDVLRESLREDFPEIFASEGLDGLTDPEFFRDIGVEPNHLRSAARRLMNEAEVLGRPMVDLPTAPGSVARVAGTAEAVYGAPGAYLIARTSGASRISHEVLGSERPTGDYGIAMIMEPSGTADPGYALQSVLSTTDAVAAAAALAMNRDDTRSWSSAAAAYLATTELLQGLFVFAREEVSYRLDVCVGAPITGGVDQIEIELLGTGEDASALYEVWWGEGGLQCATRGDIEGVPCNEADWRVAVTPTVETDGALSGFPSKYLQWTITPSSIPTGGGGSSSALPTIARLYVTKRLEASGQRRIVLGGTSLEPGDDSGTFSRCVQLPAGPSVGDRMEDILGASPDACTRPHMTCAGVPLDTRLPLEDELTEAMEGRDDIESSFFHYLRLARNAADEADRLGEELIEQGLTMDLRAEAAADELEDLCGTVVNVATIPGTGVDAACSIDTDCPDPGAQRCVAGRCQPRDLSDLVPGEDPDTDSLRHCLGSDAELQTVSLGSQPLCFYRRPGGGAACACDPATDGVSCPPCPAFDCTTAAYTNLASLGWSVETVDNTLNLVDPAVGGAGPGNCDLFARLVAGAGPVPDSGVDQAALLADVQGQDWLSHSNVVQTMQNLGFEEDLLEMDALVRGGRAWASLGSARSGPSTRWPCGPLDPVDSDQYAQICVSPPSEVLPLRCGRTCTTAADRQGVSGELQHMLMTLGALAGGRFPLPHGLRSPSGHADSDSVAIDLLPAVQMDNTYCDTDEMLGSGCMSRILHNPGEDFSRGHEGAESVTARCISLTGGAEAGSEDALARQFGICPHAMIAVSPFEAEIGDRRLALAAWDPGGQVDGAITDYVDSSVTPDTQVGFLDVAPVGSHPHTGDFRDYLADETDWYHPTVSHSELMRSLELLCLATGSGGTAACGSADELPTVRTLEDLEALSNRLQCAADGFDRLAELLILENIPADIAEQVRTGAIESTYPEYRGTYGTTVAELRAELETLPESTRTIASVLRSFSGEVAIARSQLHQEDLEAQIEGWQLAAELADQTARCVSASVGAGGPNDKAGISAAAQCAAAAVNIAAAIATTIIRAESREEDVAQIGTGVAIRFGERMDQLNEAQATLSRGVARVNGVLARLETQRSQARRLASRILFLERDDVGREYQVNRVMHARMNTLRIRYERAHRNAIRLAYLARRAIEQRLAVDLSTMTDEMTLVPPPATWADGLCAMRGIDYAELRGDGDSDVTDYSDRYVGDYVNLLELLVESYRLDYPFTDGDDISVVSLRDDVLGARTQCDVVGHNRFAWSMDFAQDGASAIAEASGWLVASTAGERCPVVIPEDGGPFHADADGVPGSTGQVTRLRSGGESRAFRFTSACPPGAITGGTCTAAAGGSRYQDVVLETGDYLVSWYERLPASLATSMDITTCTPADCVSECMAGGGSMSDCSNGCLDSRCLSDICAAATPATTDSAFQVSVTGLSGAAPSWVDAADTFISASGDRWLDACNWRRVSGRFHNPADQTVRVAFSVIVLDPMVLDVGGVLAAPQLERLDPGVGAMMSVPPLPFFPTDSDLASRVGLCEDTTGEAFRSERYWVRGCEYVCPDGFGTTCAAADLTERSRLRCYRETRFAISIDDIDRGELIPTGGFAIGNFNYRFNTFALSLVGTGVRDCSSAESPSSCYASGFIPYSLRHAGPFRVRNHLGELVDAPLFIGNVEFAKALAAERYLTNPVSSADRALLADYERAEFRGRPLDGQYRLRIYDADGFNWDAVEDVQMVLRYRYWTRFE